MQKKPMGKKPIGKRASPFYYSHFLPRKNGRIIISFS
jgi:hypothetical protein